MKKEQVTSTRTVYLDKCPKCKQDIKGFSESNLKYNMRLHKEKHNKLITELNTNQHQEEKII